MSKVTLLKLIIFSVIVFSFLFPFIGQTSTKNNGDDKRGKSIRPDRIIIQLGAGLSKEEMPPVDFLHDHHTDALEGKCTACHTEQEDGFAFTFKRTKEKASMALYHEGCIACHTEKKSSGSKSGPMAAECRSCHIKGKEKKSSREKIKFSRPLHFVHESAGQIKGMDAQSTVNCSACHHKYNEKTKEIYYTKGEEESCGYCHKETSADDIRPLQKASHDSCVKCHQSLKAKNIAAGPVSCKSCHDVEEQGKIMADKKNIDIPRLDRSQPDEVAITGWKQDGKDQNSFMEGVAFNHKSHEVRTRSCNACHHEALKKCNDCHKPEGSDLKGGFVSLSEAMHSPGNTRSCIGCHKDVTKSSDCAGCHFQMPSKKEGSDSCIKCHNLKPEQLKVAKPAVVAKIAVEKMTSGYTKLTEDKIPEVVSIDILSNEYREAKFPHRKVIRAITERVEKSEMAKAFHTDEAGLCMGCHHNSPKTLEPPKCASCHSKEGTGLDGKPGLKGAYHGQCMTCHQKMEIVSPAATECAKCHEEKK